MYRRDKAKDNSICTQSEAVGFSGEVEFSGGKHDDAFFRSLFQDYFGQLVGFAEYILADREEAENVVQECFIRLWERGTHSDIFDMRSYLFRQVKNACLNVVKHLQVEDRHNKWIAEAYMYSELPDGEYDDGLVEKVWQAVDELPEQTRAVFVACVVDGKKYREVAEEYAISVNTVNTYVKRAYKFLRERLGVQLLFFLCVRDSHRAVRP